MAASDGGHRFYMNPYLCLKVVARRCRPQRDPVADASSDLGAGAARYLADAPRNGYYQYAHKPRIRVSAHAAAFDASRATVVEDGRERGALQLNARLH